MPTLPRYDLAVLDNVPRAASGASVYVYNQPTTGITAPTNDGAGTTTPGSWSTAATPLATIYSDNQGLNPLPNPFVLDGNGNGWFYAVAGLYTVVVTGGTLDEPSILTDQNLLLAVGGGALIQVNGVSNSVQTLLNLVQGSNITIAASGGNVTITGTAAPITFKVNGSNASSQVLQNLINGTGITIADGGSGNITISATSALLLKVNGTPNGSQSLLNLKSGTHATVTDDGVGGITIASAYPIFQVNGTPLTSSSTVNYQAGSGILVSNPSAGVVSIAALSSAFQTASLAITSPQLLALKTTPIQLVVAPGAGFQNVIQSVQIEFIPAGTPYATVTTADVAVYVDSTKASNFIGDSTGLIDQSAKTYELVSATTSKFFTTDTHSTNQPIMIANVGAANYTAGNGTLLVTVNYLVNAVV